MFLRRGRVNLPHFAHFAGEGSSSCEEYYPNSTGGSFESAVSGADDDLQNLGLAVQLTEDAWGLLLRMPEIPSSELGSRSLQELCNAGVDVTTADRDVARAYALDLRPGVGMARVAVPPSLFDYHCRPCGQWPAGINRCRWRTRTPGLLAVGTLFRMRAGEWTRLREHSTVEWGESLILVAVEASSISQRNAHLMPGVVESRGLRWRLWTLTLPVAQDHAVEVWLGRLNYRVRPPRWRLQILSVPLSYDANLPQYAADQPLVFALHAPTPGASTESVVRLGTNRHTVQVQAGADSTLYGEVLPRFPTSGQVLIGRDDHHQFGLVCSESVVAAVPQLRVRIGAVEWLPWQDSSLRHADRTGEVAVEVGVEGARLDLTVLLRGGRRRLLLHATTRDVAARITEVLSEAISIEVDAGGLGRVRIEVEADPSSVVQAPSRLTSWIQAVANAVGQDEGTTIQLRGPRLTRPAPAWLGPVARANERSRK